MNAFSRVSLVVIWSAFALALAACQKKEEPAAMPEPAPAPAVAEVPAAPDVVNVPVSVRQVTLGNKIDAATKQPAMAMSSFAAGDTIYAVVDTIGSGKAAVKALWTYHAGDQVAQVNETVQEIDAAGQASTEFHVSKPSGWPEGDYQVEIFVNEASAGTYKFSVK